MARLSGPAVSALIFGVHVYYGLLVQTMPRLRLRPHGLIPDIAFGREPSNSTDGTFTRVVSGFPGARLKTEMEERNAPRRGQREGKPGGDFRQI